MIKEKKSKSPKRKPNSDVRGTDGESWLYSDIVKEHFFNPKNFMRYEEEKKFKFNATGRVGSPACGDEMVIWLQIDPKTEKIKDCRWRTFGCGSAIASTSVMSEMIIENGGMSIHDALKLTAKDILARLGGLPDRKIHCSVLGDKALQAAINDYFRQTGQHDKIMTAGAKVIDADLNITDRDIEEAVLEGAQTFEDVQKKLKVGAAKPESRHAIEELIRYYFDKYYA